MMNNYKEQLTQGYNNYLAEHGTTPNAVWIGVTMDNEDGYDTPNFCGYALIMTDEQEENYWENNTLPIGVSDLDVLIITDSIESLIKGIEEHDFEFTLDYINNFETLEYNED